MISLQRIFALSLAGLILWNCESKTPPMEYMPDMADSPAREAQEADSNFPNNTSLRLPPVGAVPQGHYPYEYAGFTDVEKLPNKGLTNPYKSDLVNLKRGEDRYQTYCSPCHGVRGQGNGTVVGPAPRLNAPREDGPMATLVSTKVKGFSDGQIYHVITEGNALMKSYASQVPTEDRWKIILYVRKLQEYDNRTAGK
ncbi:cytochrome C [Leptospira hartskeerlii]|uniref:Cytochrome C n=1 Tax=Leptospira hartskeerlii TaxID=2023177 RepID=A0A2M9X8M0_9LEPT|nr:cytochrome c [Leptospira hartskeerlii]PJZ24004.1 cytochrome C [Leptospira hartskeerlii]PJZ32070.1 cytochrome C [Leptospira hartskeerlii]